MCINLFKAALMLIIHSVFRESRLEGKLFIFISISMENRYLRSVAKPKHHFGWVDPKVFELWTVFLINLKNFTESVMFFNSFGGERGDSKIFSNL